MPISCGFADPSLRRFEYMPPHSGKSCLVLFLCPAFTHGRPVTPGVLWLTALKGICEVYKDGASRLERTGLVLSRQHSEWKYTGSLLWIHASGKTYMS
jgi:hypothetical protein